ncbi:MAG: TraC family protein [Desulfobacterales bacterium]|nr:TraC family protein [Desulfobacterales bacterium]
MISFFINKFLGKNLSHDDLKKLTYKNQFSKYLPYRWYDPETKAYYNTDNTIGFAWECCPIIFANEQIFNLIGSLINTQFPEGTVMQFILYADPYTDPILQEFQLLKNRQNELSQKSTENTVNFYKAGKYGIKKLSGIPLRSFRVFVTIKFPQQTKEKINYLDTRDNIQEVLRGIYLAPESISPETLINTLSKFFNDNIDYDFGYNPQIDINKQIILSETTVNTKFDKIYVGEKILRCVTVKKMPIYINPLTFNLLAGDIWGVQGDNNQINSPFLFTVNIIFQRLSQKLHGKCNFVLQQQGFGSLAPSLKRKQEEFLWATDELERGTQFLRLMPIFWQISNNEERCREAVSRTKRIWQSNGFVVQEDRGILNILLISALPFGLYTDDKALDYIDRDFICQPMMAAKCLPIQADFMGGGAPVNLFLGRKGQIVSLDLFAPISENYNAFITATSGSGKSVLMNYLCYNYFSSGAECRVIDVGHSYKKLCNILKGRYISFTKNADIILNPFTNIENIDENIETVSAIICQMTYSSSLQAPSETEQTLIKNAIRNSFEYYGNDCDIDKIYEYLKDPTKWSDELAELECGKEADGNNCISDIKTLSTNLAFNLRNFTSKGSLGRWFNGKANLNIANDPFVVLELNELKPQPELFKVITIQLLSYITSNLYLTDRSKRKLIIFDEAWQFCSDSAKDEKGILARIIEEGYRQARKYGGSFITITQSLLDIKSFGTVGRVIFSNSAYKFLLQSPDFDMAAAEKIINYPEFTMQLLKSVKSAKPKYSEIFVEGPTGIGIIRLALDPFSYYMYTSDAKENALIEEMVKSGMSYAEAIEEMVKQSEQN